MNKRFDAVEWMRKRRAEIDGEDEGLSWQEKSKRTLKAIQTDPVWRKLKRRMVFRVGSRSAKVALRNS